MHELETQTEISKNVKKFSFFFSREFRLDKNRNLKKKSGNRKEVHAIFNNSVRLQMKHSITCIQRPLKGSNESGLLLQVVFKCRFY